MAPTPRSLALHLTEARERASKAVVGLPQRPSPPLPPAVVVCWLSNGDSAALGGGAALACFAASALLRSPASFSPLSLPPFLHCCRRTAPGQRHGIGGGCVNALARTPSNSGRALWSHPRSPAAAAGAVCFKGHGGGGKGL